MVTGVAVGYAKLFGVLRSVVGVVTAVQVKRGRVEMNAVCTDAETLGGLGGGADEQLGEISLVEFVQDPSKTVVV
jgi:hypothetical protein